MKVRVKPDQTWVPHRRRDTTRRIIRKVRLPNRDWKEVVLCRRGQGVRPESRSIAPLSVLGNPLHIFSTPRKNNHMKKAIIALALVCTPMVWAHGPGHYRPGENPHDPRHRAAAHDARPVPSPARPQAPGVRPQAPGPQRPVPGVQRPQPPRPQAPAMHRPAPQGHPATPTTQPSRHQNVGPSYYSDSTNPFGNANKGPGQAEPGASGSGGAVQQETRRSLFRNDNGR